MQCAQIHFWHPENDQQTIAIIFFLYDTGNLKVDEYYKIVAILLNFRLC